MSPNLATQAFLDAITPDTQVWTAELDALYAAVLQECDFIDPLVKEILPNSNKRWVIFAIADRTPAHKWMGAEAKTFWSETPYIPLTGNSVRDLLEAGCALEYSRVGQEYISCSGLSKSITAVAKRLLQTPNDTIIEILKNSSTKSTNAAITLLPELIKHGWDVNGVWDDPNSELSEWIHHIIKLSNGGSVLVTTIPHLETRHAYTFGQWVVETILANHGSHYQWGFQQVDEVFAVLPTEVTEACLEHLTTRPLHPRYSDWLIAQLQNRTLQKTLSDHLGQEGRRKI